MKKIMVIFFLIIWQSGLDAQITDKVFVDLNIGRYARVEGPSFLNGFNIGLSTSKKWQYYLGARKIDVHSINSYNSFGKTGMEFKLGAKFSPRGDKRVFLGYGLELFDEISNFKGIFKGDTPPGQYLINYRRNYLGIAPSLTLNVKLDKRIFLFADTRLRLGKVNYVRKGNTHPNFKLSQPEYWKVGFEPLNSIGIRFKFK